MRVLALCGLIVAVLMFGTCSEPSHPSSETTRSTKQALDRFSPPIHQAPNLPGAFVIRDKNISAFFKNGGMAISIGNLRRASSGYLADHTQSGIPNQGLFMSVKGPPRIEPLSKPVNYRLGIHWGLVGGRVVEPTPKDELEARINYMVGDRSRWKTGLAGYSRVLFEDVYDGVDLVLQSRPHGVKYSLIAAPGAIEQEIWLRYQGVTHMKIQDGGGALEVNTGMGALRESDLHCYQVDYTGIRHEVPASYRAVRAGTNFGEWEYSIHLEDYDPEFPLVIDPVIEWSSFLGGGGDYAFNAKTTLDADGYVYIVGETEDSNFPASGGFNSEYRGNSDVFVMKVDPSGSSVLWASIIGGSDWDGGWVDIDLDDAKNIYITGYTDSRDFPACGAMITSHSGNDDAFVTKINADGASIIWSIFLGGSTADGGRAIFVDGNRDVFVYGSTRSDDFPIVGGFQPALGGPVDVYDQFIAKINAAGSAILWSSYLGGSATEQGANAIFVDATGDVYLAGTTLSNDFPIVGGFDNTLEGFMDAFIMKVNAAGDTILYSSLLGGGGMDDGRSLAVDGAGNMYIVGITDSADFPVSGGFDTTLGGMVDGYVAKINAAGSAIVWASYLGGDLDLGGQEYASDVALDGSNNVYVVGDTEASDFPAGGCFDNTMDGNTDAYLVKVRANGSQILWGTFLGGSGDEKGYGLTLDSSLNVLVTGRTTSNDFPIVGGFDNTLDGGTDHFIARVSADCSAIDWSSYIGGGFQYDTEQGQGIAIDTTGNVYIVGETFSGNFPTPGGFDTVIVNTEAVVAKFSPDGANLLWASFFGGTQSDHGMGIAVDGSENVYITGLTYSDDIPIVGGFDGARGGSEDAFVAKVAPSGASLVYSSYLGGSAFDNASDIAVDSAGAAYVTGTTRSNDFPSSGGFDGTLGGTDDAYVAKVNAAGDALVWSSYLGGSDIDTGSGIKVDDLGNVYIVGDTWSNDLNIVGGFDNVMDGARDAFVAKVNAAGNSLAWSSYLGGTDADVGTEIAIDGSYNVYVTGRTFSADFPVPGGFQGAHGGGTQDAFVTKIDSTGGSILWSSYLGGSSDERGEAIAVDSGNNVFLTGSTNSTDFPVNGGFQMTYGGPFSDAFVTMVDSSGASRTWSSFLGGSGDDVGKDLTVDTNGDIYVTGFCGSPDLAFFHGYDTSLTGAQDVFILKIDNAGTNTPPVANAGWDFSAPRTTQIYLSAAGSFDPNGDPLTYSWLQTGGTPVVLSSDTSPAPSFDTPNVLFDEVLTFQLTVHDGTVGSSPDTVDVSVLACLDQPNGAPCGNVGVLCVQDDACDGFGTCVAGGPEANGTPCDDSDQCTQTDECQAGACLGSNPVICTALDQCHDAGICNPGDGICTDPPKPDGNPCDDGNACSTLDTCQGGICTAGAANKDTDGDTYIDIACPPGDDCDDNEITVNPGATEGPFGDATCSDTWDNDCDTFTDMDDTECTNCAIDADCDDGNICMNNTCPAGACIDTPVADGTGCDDSDQCTQTDTCQAGSCSGANPVVCTPLDQCHDAGTCIPATGICTDPAKADGFACDDSDLCTGTDTCQTGVCTGSDPVVCSALDQCHDVGVCIPATGICPDPNKTDGSPCDDSDLCTGTDTCQGGVCIGSDPVVCTPLTQCHDAGTCNPVTGICPDPTKPDGSPCDDGDLCTQTDTCQGGVCTGANPVVCTPLDQCHDAGTCNPVTGICTDPPKSDGSPCDDLDMCTQTDTCQAGACTGSNPVICTALDQCHDIGTCDSGTGVCSNPQKSDGSPCDDGDNCSTNDTCQAGTCTTGATNKDTDTDTYFDDACPGGNDCDDNESAVNPGEIENKTQGSTCSDTWDNDCDTLTDMADPDCMDCIVDGDCDDGNVCTVNTCPAGSCVDTPVADGSACDDLDQCTTLDGCQAGICVGTNPVVCTALDQCHDVGVCNPGTGICTDPPKPDDTPCNDGQYCIVGETCQAGVCTGSLARNCSAWDDQCNMGDCDDVLDTCYANPLPGGTACDDSDLCTQTDECQAGSCVGSDPVICTPLDQCKNAGVCNPGTGLCTNPPKTDGTPCDDSDLCTQTDTCQGGVCTGSNPVVCTPLDDCHTVGVCNPGTGICTDPPEIDGAPCDDGQYCNENENCLAGNCQGGNALDCSIVADQCNSGTCNEVDDRCDQVNLPNTTPCDADGAPCTMNDACTGGTCIAGPPLDGDSDGFVSDLCPGGDDCNDADGTINPGVFEGPIGSPICTDTVDNDCDTLIDAADPQCSACVVDADCDDNNICNGIETCAAPNCQGGNSLDCDDSNDCTDDSCDGLAGCQYSFNSGPCDDGLFCTASDSCDGAGNCTINTGTPCTTQCMEVCNDTSDRCDPDPIGTACNDGEYCTNPDTCDGAGTCGGLPRDCSAFDDQCNVGACDNVGDTCYADPVPRNNRTCDDALYCNVGEICLNGACGSGAPRDCSSFGDQCNVGACDENTDACYSNPAPLQGNACNDSDMCTLNDVCNAGACQGPDSLLCNDGNPCTNDGCDDAQGGCFYTNAREGNSCGDGGTCDDNNVYWNTTCQGGVCLPTQPPDDCDDGNDCTDDKCDDASGCSNPLNSAPCDDGYYCTEGTLCDQGACVGGEEKSCSDEAGDCWQGRCREEFDWCELGEPEGPTTVCNVGDPCTAEGLCNGRGACRIEGFCDVIKEECETQTPAVVYVPGDPDATDCRLGHGKVGMVVEVKPTPGGVGTFVPVRVLMSNTIAGGWNKELSELRVLLTLNPKNSEDIEIGGKVAYVMGSALLQGGELQVEDDASAGDNRAVFRLFVPGAVDDVQMMPAPGGGIWALDFVLMRGEDLEGVFKLDVWAPCECLDAEIGCHYGYDRDELDNEIILDLELDESIGRSYLQRISSSKYVSTSGKIIDPEDADNIGELLKSPVMGCQCGTRDGGGWSWLLLLLLAAIFRKYRV